MKKLIIVFIILLAFACKDGKATNLRGQIVRYINGTYYPLANVRVDFLVWNGQGWAYNSYAITGNDGFYYFINFSPGYTFCVMVLSHYYPAQQPLVIQNIPPPYYQDLPIIST